MPLYLGKGQIGICQRCGFKYKRAELKEDGRLKNLLVCSDCWDGEHPQDYPPISRIEGQPPMWPSPENLSPPSAPVLTGQIEDGPDDEDIEIHLEWTEAVSASSMILRYELYRSVNGGAAAIVHTITVPRTFTGEPLLFSLSYEDADISVGNAYSYYVVATAIQGGSSTSNIEEFEIEEDSTSQATAPVLSGNWVALDQIDLSWTSSTIVGSTIDHYELFRNEDGGAFSLVASVDDGDPLEFEDTDVELDVVYTYYVVAIPNAGSESEDSNIVEIETSSQQATTPVLTLDEVILNPLSAELS